MTVYTNNTVLKSCNNQFPSAVYANFDTIGVAYVSLNAMQKWFIKKKGLFNNYWNKQYSFEKLQSLNSKCWLCQLWVIAVAYVS